ncbi:MAG: cyclophilin-like family protein [Candidatus Caldarchaeum sp.]|nr:cyclophilin-like family protein [Candidatus Caldarchaeum sp.]
MKAARIPIVVHVEGLSSVEGELHRFAAPLTVDEIIKRLPLEGYVARWETAVYMITEMSRGVEKSSSKLSAGDLFYWSPGKAVGVALVEHVPRSQTIKVGSVGEGFREFMKARPGARMRIVSKIS